MGCYNDAPDRALPTLAQPATLTILACKAACVQLGFRLYGLEAGLECYCGNSVAQASIYGTAGAVCDAPCADDPARLCGGFWTLSLFDTVAGSPLLPTTAVPSTTVARCSSHAQCGATQYCDSLNSCYVR